MRKCATRYLLGAMAVSLAMGLIPMPASADEEIPQSVAAEVEDYTSRVEETAVAYDLAIARQRELEQEISELDAQIAAKEEALPVLERRASEAAVTLYKYGDGLVAMIDIVFESESLSDAISRIDSYNRFMNYYGQAAAEMREVCASLNSDKEQRSFDLEEASEAAQAAEDALEEAKAARQKAVEDAIARQKAAEEEAARVAAQAERAGNQIQHGSTPGISAGEINWNVSKEEFVREWTARIDHYLAGSEMAGCGGYYATAAWNYGVDPRWAPAISCVESGKGSICFRTFNAWGYGSRNFSSWEEGIDTVVKALGSSLYGGAISYAAAQTYCPPNADYWFTWCSSEMRSI